MFINNAHACKFLCIAAISLAITGCFSTAKLPVPAESTSSAAQILAQKRQELAFGQVAYTYFQDAPDKTLLQDSLARLNELIAQTPYAVENRDRLDLMKGAASLQLGMTTQAENIFNRLLTQSADPYIQANTWFWLAKSSFSQKRLGMSERAYNTIVENDIEDELSDEHWEELIYQVSHERMNSGGDWESLAQELRSDSIYHTYLIANQAIMAHNQQDFDTANGAFITAKLRLNEMAVANSIQIEDSKSWLSWFRWSDNGVSESNDNQVLKERNALFDRLNYGLGISLLEQKDYANALLALKLIGNDSLQAEQALLTYGWTLAQESRWPLAMAAWQYLRDNSQGIYALQASHGLAYGYEQQGALAEAFGSLRDSSRQLDMAINSLREFDLKVQQADFFDSIHVRVTNETSSNIGDRSASDQPASSWPIEHRDLQILLLSGDGEIDSAYLLSVRRQAKQLLTTLQLNLAQIDGMYRLLNEREQAFISRSGSLSLSDAQAILEITEVRIQKIESILDVTSGSSMAGTLSSENEISALKPLASINQVLALERLEKAEQRIVRVNNERKRQLSKKYTQRVARLKGMLAWELNEAYPESRWQHHKQLNKLKKAFANANKQYQQLQQLQNDTSSIDAQRSRVDMIAATAQEDFARTNALIDSLTLRLTHFLRANMALRMQELSDQQVATRLAIIRLQDLAQPARGQ